MKLLKILIFILLILNTFARYTIKISKKSQNPKKSELIKAKISRLAENEKKSSDESESQKESSLSEDESDQDDTKVKNSKEQTNENKTKIQNPNDPNQNVKQEESNSQQDNDVNASSDSEQENSNSESDGQDNEDNSNSKSDIQEKKQNSNSESDGQDDEDNSNSKSDVQEKKENSNRESDGQDKENNSKSESDVQEKDDNSNSESDGQDNENNSKSESDGQIEECEGEEEGPHTPGQLNAPNGGLAQLVDQTISNNGEIPPIVPPQAQVPINGAINIPAQQQAFPQQQLGLNQQTPQNQIQNPQQQQQIQQPDQATVINPQQQLQQPTITSSQIQPQLDVSASQVASQSQLSPTLHTTQPNQNPAIQPVANQIQSPTNAQNNVNTQSPSQPIVTPPQVTTQPFVTPPQVTTQTTQIPQPFETSPQVTTQPIQNPPPIMTPTQGIAQPIQNSPPIMTPTQGITQPIQNSPSIMTPTQETTQLQQNTQQAFTNGFNQNTQNPTSLQPQPQAQGYPANSPGHPNNLRLQKKDHFSDYDTFKDDILIVDVSKLKDGQLIKIKSDGILQINFPESQVGKSWRFKHMQVDQAADLKPQLVLTHPLNEVQGIFSYFYFINPHLLKEKIDPFREIEVELIDDQSHIIEKNLSFHVQIDAEKDMFGLIRHDVHAKDKKQQPHNRYLSSSNFIPTRRMNRFQRIKHHFKNIVKKNGFLNFKKHQNKKYFK